MKARDIMQGQSKMREAATCNRQCKDEGIKARRGQTLPHGVQGDRIGPKRAIKHNG